MRPPEIHPAGITSPGVWGVMDCTWLSRAGTAAGTGSKCGAWVTSNVLLGKHRLVLPSLILLVVGRSGLSGSKEAPSSRGKEGSFTSRQQEAAHSISFPASRHGPVTPSSSSAPSLLHTTIPVGRALGSPTGRLSPFLSDI